MTQMLKERFAAILKEYHYTDHLIEFLWKSGPYNNINEQRLHEIACKTGKICTPQ